MEYLRQADIRPQPGETVYRHAVLPKVIGGIVTGSVAAFLLWFAWHGGIPHEKLREIPPAFLWVFGGILALVSLGVRGLARAAARTEHNWLVRLGPGGLRVKFRSYLNVHFPEQDVVAVDIPFSDMEWVRHVRETRYTPGGSKGETNIAWLHHLEIQPRGGVDLTELTEHLNRERAAHAPKVKRWYGDTGWKHHDYPVSVTPQGTIRVHWRVRPKMADLLERLKTRVAVRPYHKEKNDLRGQRTVATDVEKLEALRQLAPHTRLGAVILARRLFGLSLKDARQLVDALAAGRQPEPEEEVTAFIAKAAHRERTPAGV